MSVADQGASSVGAGVSLTDLPSDAIARVWTYLQPVSKRCFRATCKWACETADKTCLSQLAGELHCGNASLRETSLRSCAGEDSRRTSWSRCDALRRFQLLLPSSKITAVHASSSAAVGQPQQQPRLQLQPILQGLGSLCHLELSRCGSLTEPDIQAIAACCPHLASLHISRAAATNAAWHPPCLPSAPATDSCAPQPADSAEPGSKSNSCVFGRPGGVPWGLQGLLLRPLATCRTLKEVVIKDDPTLAGARPTGLPPEAVFSLGALTQLRSLSLHGAALSVDLVFCLSSLVGLTRLELGLVAEAWEQGGMRRRQQHTPSLAQLTCLKHLSLSLFTGDDVLAELPHELYGMLVTAGTAASPGAGAAGGAPGGGRGIMGRHNGHVPQVHGRPPVGKPRTSSIEVLHLELPAPAPQPQQRPQPPPAGGGGGGGGAPPPPGAAFRLAPAAVVCRAELLSRLLSDGMSLERLQAVRVHGGPPPTAAAAAGVGGGRPGRPPRHLSPEQLALLLKDGLGLTAGDAAGDVAGAGPVPAAAVGAAGPEAGGAAAAGGGPGGGGGGSVAGGAGQVPRHRQLRVEQLSLHVSLRVPASADEILASKLHRRALERAVRGSAAGGGGGGGGLAGGGVEAESLEELVQHLACVPRLELDLCPGRLHPSLQAFAAGNAYAQPAQAVQGPAAEPAPTLPDLEMYPEVEAMLNEFAKILGQRTGAGVNVEHLQASTAVRKLGSPGSRALRWLPYELCRNLYGLTMQYGVVDEHGVALVAAGLPQLRKLLLGRVALTGEEQLKPLARLQRLTYLRLGGLEVQPGAASSADTSMPQPPQKQHTSAPSLRSTSKAIASLEHQLGSEPGAVGLPLKALALCGEALGRQRRRWVSGTGAAAAAVLVLPPEVGWEEGLALGVAVEACGGGCVVELYGRGVAW